MRGSWIVVVAMAAGCSDYEFDPSNIVDQGALEDSGEPEDAKDPNAIDAVDDTIGTLSGVSVRFDPTANDNGRRLTIVNVGTPDSGGEARQVAQAEIVYTPAAEFVGTETFTYTIIDRNEEEATATVTAEVSPLPTIEFTGPKEGSEITGDSVEISFIVNGCLPSLPSQSPDECHIHMYVDDTAYSFESDGRGHYVPDPRTLEGLEPGEHTIEFRMVTNDGSDAEYMPFISDEVTITIVEEESKKKKP